MSESYQEIFVKSVFAQGDFLSFLTLFFLFMARFLPIITLSPFFGAKVLPHPVKMTFAISMFFVFLPQLLSVTKEIVPFDSRLILYMLKELFIGVSLGFFVSMPFIIVQSAGTLIDHQRGAASLMVNDPTIQNQASPLGILFNLIMIYIFFMINGPFLFIDAIVDSYAIIPPDQFISPDFFARSSSFWDMQFKLLGRFMDITIRLAAPAILAILMTDLFLGIVNRLAPQVQITFLGMPLKSLLALAVMFIGWRLFTGQMEKEILVWLQSVLEIIKSFRAPVLLPSPPG
jgi:type III secretion protein T